MESTTSTTVSTHPTYDPKFYAPVDLFEEAPSALGMSCHFEDTMPTLSNHPDMLMCPMYPSPEGPPPQHPLDPSPRHAFYLQNHPHQTSSTPTTENPFMHDYHLPSSASSSELNPLDHCLAHPESVPFPGHLEDFYGSCAQSSPSSYLQYLQHSPNKHQHYTLQPSTKAKADTTPLDILDPPTSIYGSNPVFSTNHPSTTTNQNKQPSLSVSTLDLSHLTMDPNCPSSIEYMDSTKPSWMLDSLDNTYLPTTLDTSLDFYESDQNHENPFYLNHHSYLSHQMPSSMSTHSLPPSSSYQNEANSLSTDCLPRGYVNLSDVNSFVTESDSIKHTNSFPHLSTSPSKCASGINGVPGDELQSLLGDISPATPSNNTNSNNSTFLSHSFVIPSYLNPQSGYSYSDSNESMDDLSDSDTTTSTQSWMIPFPQDPFFSWRDSSSTQPAASSFYPLGGLTSSMSTPVVGVGHPRPYDSHPYSHHHHHPQNNIMSPGDTIHDRTTASTIKRDKSTKKRSKQSQQQQQPGKTRRSTSGMIHTGASSRKKTSMSNIAKRKDLRRRESEPHSLSAISAYPSSSSVAMKNFSSAGSSTSFSPARLSVSTSISSLLSRQKLSDDEDEGTHHEEEDDEDNEDDDEDDDSDQGVYLPQQYRLHQDIPFAQKQQHRQHKEMEPKGLHYGELGPTSHPKKGRNVDKACNHCKRSHLRCDNMRPCRRCIATGKSGCKDVEHKPRGRPRLHNT